MIIGRKIKWILQIQKILVFAPLLLLWFHSSYANVLYTADKVFFSQADLYKFGVELEFAGLSLETVKNIVVNSLEGEAKEGKKNYEINKNGSIRLQQRKIYIVTTKKYGTIIIKPELNDLGEGTKKGNLEMVEVATTTPMSIEKYDKWLELSREIFAQGGRASPALEAGYHMTFSVGSDFSIEVLVNLLRNYYLPAHRGQILEHYKVATNRLKYLNGLTKGFIKKLYSKEYSPNKHDFLFDYLYRQTAERLGNKNAWKVSKKELRKYILNHENSIDLKVIKFTPLRISSLLCEWFPEDPLIKKILKSGWVKKRAVLEFRDSSFQNDISRRPQEVLGLIHMSKVYGAFDHDSLMAKLTSSDPWALKRIRLLDRKRKSIQDPIIVRFFLENPIFALDKSSNFFIRNHRESGSILSFVDPKYKPKYSYPLPQGAITVPRLAQHRSVFDATTNISIPNSILTQALENKWIEYTFWSNYAPESIPRSQLLSDFNIKNLESLKKNLDYMFPEGWVLKRVWDIASRPVMSNDNLGEEYNKYLHSNFDNFYKKTKKEYTGLDPEAFIEKIRTHPAYIGWRISGALTQPDKYFVQSRVEIKKEYRVEVVLGKVLGNGTTVDRWAFLHEEKQTREFSYSNKEEIKNVEEFVKRVIQKLPRRLQPMNFGMDVALLNDGSFRVIESNPGLNSGFLSETLEGIKELDRFLRVQGILETKLMGLSKKEQMNLLKMLEKKYKFSLEKQLTDFSIEHNSLEDKSILPSMNVRSNSLFSTNSISMSDRGFEVLQKIDMVRRVLGKQFTMKESYIAGGSANGFLDHILYFDPLVLRDIDLIFIADKNVSEEFAEKVGLALEREGIGDFDRKNLRPRLRPFQTNPTYNAGYGFFLNSGNEIIDVIIFNKRGDLKLNGVMDTDKILIKMPENSSSSVKRFLQISQSFRKKTPILGVKNLDMYWTWRKGKTNVAQEASTNISKNPMMNAIRIVRSKLKVDDSFRDMEKRELRDAIKKAKKVNLLQCLRNLEKLFSGSQIFTGFRLLNELGFFDKLSPRISKKLQIKDNIISIVKTHQTREIGIGLSRLLKMLKWGDKKLRLKSLKILSELNPEYAVQIYKMLFKPGEIKLGFFTGEFLPFHIGHQGVIYSALKKKLVDFVIVIPTPFPSNDPLLEKFDIKEWSLRVKIARLFLKSEPRAMVLPVHHNYVASESLRPNIGVVLERFFKKWEYGKMKAVHIMGADSFSRVLKRELLKKDPRPRVVISRLGSLKMNGDFENVHFIENLVTKPVSGTNILEEIAVEKESNDTLRQIQNLVKESIFYRPEIEKLKALNSSLKEFAKSISFDRKIYYLDPIIYHKGSYSSIASTELISPEILVPTIEKLLQKGIRINVLIDTHPVHRSWYTKLEQKVFYGYRDNIKLMSPAKIQSKEGIQLVHISKANILIDNGSLEPKLQEGHRFLTYGTETEFKLSPIWPESWKLFLKPTSSVKSCVNTLQKFSD